MAKGSIKTAFLISMLSLKDQLEHHPGLSFNNLVIDNSATLLRIDLSWILAGTGFGLFWDPEDLDNQNEQQF